MGRTLFGVTGVVVSALLAGCGGGSVGAPRPSAPSTESGPIETTTSAESAAETGTSETTAAAGDPVVARFVVLATLDRKPIDIVDVNDHKKKLLTGLKPGSVSGYARVPSAVTALDSQGRTLTGPLSGADGKNPRNTVVIGIGANGPEGYFFPEKDGVIETNGSSGLPKSMATLVSIGFGIGPDAPADAALALGSEGTCLPAVIPTDKGAVVGAGSAPSMFAAEPGALELAWYQDTECRKAVSKSVKITVDGGKSGYVFPWLADATHFRFLFVPITSDGAGNAGVIDSGAGPAFADAEDSGDTPGN